MNVAIVDVGTNSTRLLIAEVGNAGVSAERVHLSRVTRLGANVDAGRRLREDAIERTLAVIGDYRALIDEHGVDVARTVMTSAVRDAVNGRDFASQVESRFGIPTSILTGDEEARLTFLGVTDDRAPEDDHAILVIDIGGGSTEFVVGAGRDLRFHVSTQAGVVRQAERHIESDPPTDAELDAVAHDVRGIFESAVPRDIRTEVALGIAVAGTPTSLASIAQSLDPYDPDKVHGYVLTADERDGIRARLGAMPLAERRTVAGLHPDRAISILPGIVILTEVMRLFGLDAVEVSEHDILRGAAIRLRREAASG